MLMCQWCNTYVQCNCSSNTGNIRVSHCRRRNKVYRISVSGEPNLLFLSVPGLSSDTKLDGVDELAHLYYVLFGAPEFFCRMAPWGQCCVHASLYRGQDCTTCSGVVSLFHCMGSWLCVNPTTMTAGDVPQNLSQRVFSSFFSKLANIVFHWWCDYSKLANIVFHWWCDYSKLANVVFCWWCDYSKLAKSFTDDVTTAS